MIFMFIVAFVVANVIEIIKHLQKTVVFEYK